MTAVSGNYRELVGQEIDETAEKYASAWQNPEMPQRQYEAALQWELESFRRTGEECAPFAALHRCLNALSPLEHPNFLDIGASSGFVNELLERWGFHVNYLAVDYSVAFRDFARTLYPDLLFDVADASALPYHDDTFDIVLNGACLMHCRDYVRAIAEAIRISKRFVIFHRTPIVRSATKFYQKEAYGIPCLEVHFHEKELLGLFAENNAEVIYVTSVFEGEFLNHSSYLIEKRPGLNHVQV